MIEKDTPPTPKLPKHPRMENLQRGSKKSSEALGVSLAVVLSWLTGDVLGWDIPNEVMAAFLTLIGIVATRLKMDG